jgi:hypothetical protein
VKAALVLWCSIFVGACARHAAGQATDAAMQKFSEAATAGAAPGERPIAAISGRAVQAALERLERPEQLAALQKIAAVTAAEAVREALRVAATSDGHGTSPVGQMAASATDGALRRIFPQCSADDATCLDGRLAELSRRAAAGFTAGAREALGVPALLLAFVAGVLVAVLALLAINWWQARARAAPRSPVRAS